MDRTLANILSLLLAGAGLWAIWTEYSVPELQLTYLGKNPFAVKADVIKKSMAWVFTSLALLALFVQILAEILGDGLPTRNHSAKTYAWLSILGFLFTTGLVRALASVGRRVARTRWLPKIIESQREAFSSARFIVQHDGLREDQLGLTERGLDLTKHRDANFKTAEEYVHQIERLLELEDGGLGLPDRVKRLERHFVETQAGRLTSAFS